jgi:hypothetical protein
VTRDDIQRLMGGYATGSLSEAERKLLFDAALDDQDLFDQLAQEHSLKEIIDEPGVRDRLIAKLAPAAGAAGTVRGGWKRPLGWGLAASFVVGMSLLAVFVTKSSLQMRQFAQLDTSVAQPPVASSSATPVPPAPASAPSAAIATAKSSTPAKRKAVEADAKTLADRTEPLEKEQRKAESKDERARNDEKAGARKDVNITGTIAAVPAAAPPPPAPTSPAGPISGRQSLDHVQLASQLPPTVQPQGFVASREQQAPQVQNGQVRNAPAQDAQAQASTVQSLPRQSQPGAGGGGRAADRSRPAALGAPMARAAAKAAPARFAFDYAIDGEDLVFTFAADGYFSLHIVPGGLTIVDSRVTAGSTRRERINSNGTEADIVFSAAPQSTVGGLKLTSTLKSDTVEDPGGSRIELLVRFYPPPAH